MSYAKDPKVQDLILEQKSLHLKADLVAASSEAVSLVSIDNSTIAATVIEIDVKEDVSSCEKLEVIDRSTGQAVSLDAAPSISNSVISIVFSLSSTVIFTGFRIKDFPFNSSAMVFPFSSTFVSIMACLLK